MAAAGPRFGEPDDRTPDPGLFGPGSATWELHGDPIALVGGLRALLLQALHPQVMGGFVTRSDYRADPWGRLARTAEYVGTVAFGTTTEARAAGDAVRRVHRRLGLDDPALLMWVHASLVDSALQVHRRSGAGLPAERADEYVAEQVRAATLVGLQPADVPRTATELAGYLAAVRPQLQATPEAREAARFLLLPPMPARVRLLTPAAPAWTTLAATAFATLPGWAKRLYGGSLLGPALGGVTLPWSMIDELPGTVAVRAVRATLGALPPSWRVGPRQRAALTRLGLPAAA
ncbi:MAG: DUF2236 domain-containing protein [Actinomycetota bacterium]|nr:MAG: DUF2236 domain-containing protein [Actinomycetota bacterium]